MHDNETIRAIRVRFNCLRLHLDERQRRLLIAAEVKAFGPGGKRAVNLATKLHPATIRRSVDDLRSATRNMKRAEKIGRKANSELKYRIRRKGAGRPLLIKSGSKLDHALAELIQKPPRGKSKGNVVWDGPSTEDLAKRLSTKVECISARTIACHLRQMGYKLVRGRRKKQTEA